jgi:hypothetical protein
MGRIKSGHDGLNPKGDRRTKSGHDGWKLARGRLFFVMRGRLFFVMRGLDPRICNP